MPLVIGVGRSRGNFLFSELMAKWVSGRKGTSWAERVNLHRPQTSHRVIT